MNKKSIIMEKLIDNLIRGVCIDNWYERMNTTSPSMKEFDTIAMVLAVDTVDQKSNFKAACVAVEDA